MTELKELRIAGTKITDASLAMPQSLKKLQTLELQRISVSAEAIEELRKKRPDLKVSR